MRSFGVDRDGIDDRIDITEPGGADKAVAVRTDTLGGLDGVVHAVGMSGRRLGDGPVTAASDEAWAELPGSTSDSVFRLLRSCLPALATERCGGSVAVVGSALASTPTPISSPRPTPRARPGSSGSCGRPRSRRRRGRARQRGRRGARRDADVGPRRGRRAHRAASRSSSRSAADARAGDVAQAVAWLSPAAPTTTDRLPVDGGWSLR